MSLSHPAIPVRAVEIIAHRGASFDAPENTLASVKLGWKQGADAVEIDVHQTKDGKVAVMHDADTKRVAGQDLKIAGTALSELRKLDVGAWKDPIWAGEPIPELEAILATVPEGKKLFVEVKSDATILPAIEQAFKVSRRSSRELVLIGFSLETMRAAKGRFPEYQVYWLASFTKDKQSGVWGPSAEELIRKAAEARLDGLNLKAEVEVLDADFAAKIRAAGLRFYVWTVDDPAVAKKMVEIGVEGITTNRPEWLRQQLK